MSPHSQLWKIYFFGDSGWLIIARRSETAGIDGVLWSTSRGETLTRAYWPGSIRSAPPNRRADCGRAWFLRQRRDCCFSKSIVPQDPLATSAPKVTAGWGRALFLRRRHMSARFVAPKGGFHPESLFSSIERRRGNIAVAHATHHDKFCCACHRRSAFLSAGRDPQNNGTEQGVTWWPTRVTCLVSPPRTSRASARARPPPRPHSEHAFWFLSVTVWLT